MTQADITPGQYLVTTQNGDKCIVDHFWIAVVDGRAMVAGRYVKGIEKI